MIVEDELLIALEAEMTLSDAGHDVVGTAATEDAAVAMAEAERPDVAVVDLRLAGGTSGARMAERIRAADDPAVSGIAVVFASGNLDPATRASLAGLEPVAMLSKPYLPVQLIRAVARAGATPAPAPGAVSPSPPARR